MPIDSVALALANGLRFRPIKTTIADTLHWFNGEAARDWPAGISRQEEKRVLEAWANRQA